MPFSSTKYRSIIHQPATCLPGSPCEVPAPQRLHLPSAHLVLPLQQFALLPATDSPTEPILSGPLQSVRIFLSTTIHLLLQASPIT